MHIGIDALLLHGSFSGVEQSIYRLLTELSRDGGPHHYSVYVSRDFGQGHLSRPGLEFRRLGFAGADKLRRVLWTQGLFHRRARADGVELIHGAGYILPRGWRGPSAVTVYDIIALTHPHLCTPSNALYYRVFLPRAISRATAVIVPSQAVKARIIERLGVPEARLHVAPLGVSEEFTSSIPEDRLARVRRRHEITQPYLLCVGNIEPKKNLAATVEAFSLATKSGRLPHRLVLAGGKSWGGRDVEEAIQAAGPETVRRTGYVAPEDLPTLYAGAEALLFWSLVEGFGLPALEAMACGTPVICSDRGSLPEVVGDAAEIVPIGGPALLADAIRHLLASPARRDELIEKGQRRASEYTWRRHADAVLDVYAEVGENIG